MSSNLVDYEMDSDEEELDDYDFERETSKLYDSSKPSPSSAGTPQPAQGELVEPQPPRRHSEGNASYRSPEGEDDEIQRLERGRGNSSARSGEMMDTPETPRSGEDDDLAAILDEKYTAVRLPPSPPGACDPDLERKFISYFDKKAQGVQMNEKIKAFKGFKNPAMYEFLVNKYGLDEKGTNFEPHIFDPHDFDESDFYDALGEQQKKLQERMNAPHTVAKRTHGGHVSTKDGGDSYHSKEQPRKSRFDIKK